MQERSAGLKKAQGDAARYQTQIGKLTEQSNGYAVQIADLTEQLENHPPSATGLPQRQLQEQIDALTQAKQGIDEKLTESQEKLSGVQAQIAELQEPIHLEVDASQAEAVAAALQDAADAEYQANVNVKYIDNGFTPKGGGDVYVTVHYIDDGGPSGGSATTSTTSSKTSAAKTQAKSAYDSLKSSVKNTVTSAFPALAGLFEEGGRTDEPAIFGEGETAEWAIPEEHSDRTAELLNAAREASGFSWNELIARYGGLNGRSDGVVVNIGSYAPVITAQDSRGVEQKLIEDKDRLKRLVGDAVRDAMERNALHDAIEVYA